MGSASFVGNSKEAIELLCPGISHFSSCVVPQVVASNQSLLDIIASQSRWLAGRNIAH
jgi:hypothetical protein